MNLIGKACYARTHIALFQSVFLQGLSGLVNNLWVEDPKVLWSQRNVIHHLPPEPQFGPEALVNTLEDVKNVRKCSKCKITTRAPVKSFTIHSIVCLPEAVW